MSIFGKFDEHEPNLVLLFGGGESICRTKIPKLELPWPWVLISTSTNKKSLHYHDDLDVEDDEPGGLNLNSKCHHRSCGGCVAGQERNGVLAS